MQDNPDEGPVGTNVDLGDDLLETTKILTKDATQTVEDQLETVRILIQERMLEGAKTILHRLLGADPKLKRAKQILDEIHDQEIRDLLKNDSISIRAIPQPTSLESEALIADMDRSLNLNLYQEVDPSHWKSFETNLLEASKHCQPREHIDLGISMMTLGLFDAAMTQFEMARKDPELGRNADVLKFQALFEAGKIAEAGIFGESLLRHEDLSDSDRLFVLYLLGRLYEGLGKKSEARIRYQQILNQDAGYRDCEARLRMLVGG